MSETPSSQATPERRVSRTRIVTARVLVVLGVLLLVVSILANFVKREALDNETFRNTSSELIANETIRTEVAATVVDEFYANVDVAGELEEQLPDNLKALASPIAGLTRELAERAAVELLERPRVQQLFVTASGVANKQLVALLDGDTRALDTTDGKVVVDLRPIVFELGSRFGIDEERLDVIPVGATQITVLDSDELGLAQDLTKILRTVADWIWVFVFALWIAAVWLVAGRRRYEVRAIAIGLVVAGLALVVIRSLAGSYIVDSLVQTESVKPAIDEVWAIVTDGLAAAAWTIVLIGLVALLGIWFVGPGRRATAVRSLAAPYLRRPDVAYGALAVALLLFLWWAPLQGFRNVMIVLVLSIAGFEVTRRQTAREFPEAIATDLGASLRESVERIRGGTFGGKPPEQGSPRPSAPPADESDGSG